MNEVYELKLDIYLFLNIKAQQIVKRAQRFMKRNLLPNHILCYHVQVLQEYSKRLISSVKILSDMELVQHEIDESHIKKDNCVCHGLEVESRFENFQDYHSFRIYF